MEKYTKVSLVLPKTKQIKKRFRINVTKQIKRFTKFQGKSLTMRKLLQKCFCQVNK